MRALFAPWSEEKIVDWRARTTDHPFYSHITPAETEVLFKSRGWPFESYVKFTSVRNPFPRLVSLYRMIGRVDGVWRLRRQIGLRDPAFASWLKGTQPNGSGGGGRPHQRWRRYGTWSAQHWCDGKIDHVLRLEYLEEDLDALLPRLGIAPSETVPHVNRTPSMDWVNFYNENSVALVSRRYAWDMQTFGYACPMVNEAA